MLFGQKTHPLNFEYGTKLSVEDNNAQLSGNSFNAWIRCDDVTDFCTRLCFDNANISDKRKHSDGIIERYRRGRPIRLQHNGHIAVATGNYSVEIGVAHLKVQLADGILLQTTPDGIGFNGEKLIINFDVTGASGFYGFGERTKNLNKSGDSMDFWNVDVVFAFPHTYGRDDYDPAYVAIPFAIIKASGGYSGVYFDNPGRVVIDVEKTRPKQMMYQSMTGNTDVYFIDGPSLRDVVRNFTELTGRAAVPPPWSVGYHQCRWGYKTEADIIALQENFEKFGIPVSAFWYDIDYMDGYRVFTWDRVDFPAPAALNTRLKDAGIRTVTIVDPGVKLESGYTIYESGKTRDIFCKTVSGRDYVGSVWPGDTVFPDFSLEAGQAWWAEQLATFIRESAIDGIWIDMNDPATGYSADEDMLFDNGRVAHEPYHNQYGHFMAKASLRAFDTLDENARPFLLTRSGFTGTQRYSAIWTGDNASSWRHLRMAIPCTINLGLSGVAFNGPDVGGFMGNTTPELLIRWYQAGFLFPFFRNHSMLNSKRQEPWELGPECLACVRETIKTRYRLLPCLYQCFFEHYLTGDPVLRPLLYHYDGQEFENLDDQYLVGDSIMVAPVLYGESEGREILIQGRKCQLRHILFPDGWWFDLNIGEWIEGGRTLPYAASLDEVPIFIRDGAVIPYYNGPLRNSLIDLDTLELHIFSREQPGRLAYFIDDQKSREYQKGRYNTAHISAEAGDHEVRVNIVENGGYPVGTVSFTPVLYGCQGEWKAVVTTNGNLQSRTLQPSTRSWVSKQIGVQA